MDKRTVPPLHIKKLPRTPKAQENKKERETPERILLKKYPNSQWGDPYLEDEDTERGWQEGWEERYGNL